MKGEFKVIKWKTLRYHTKNNIKGETIKIKTMKNTHQVLDLMYTPEEGQECFEGSEQECYDFIEQQGGSSFMYKVVPILNLK